ncbi:hypothetical protein, partial [Nocardiopsis sp. LOL_012]|uniref:hypothetical protein n=1 Tax=Nocardiopsis sp. LOL_012 TaxID=3345409 RepID=UPI003A893AE0
DGLRPQFCPPVAHHHPQRTASGRSSARPSPTATLNRRLAARFFSGVLGCPEVGVFVVAAGVRDGTAGRRPPDTRKGRPTAGRPFTRF